MGRFLRTVTLVQVFPRILRAVYPDRPALADEIQSYNWDYWGGVRFWFGTHLTSDEIIAVNEAFKLLDEFVVARRKIRLRGAPGHPSKRPEDIEPADVTGSKLHVFDGKLLVFEGNKHIKTYYRVHCYETDVNRCVAKLRSGNLNDKAPPPKITNAMIDDHIRRYTESTPRHTGDGCEKAWATQHGSAARARLRVRYRDHVQKRGNKIKEGRPQKLAK